MIPEDAAVFPPSVIYGILLLGVGLVFFRPYWAYLLSVLLPVAVNGRTMTFSRLPGLGAYFNMTDACLYICILAATADCIVRRQRFTVTRVIGVLVALLFIGFANVTFVMSYSYESLRSLRWALTLPIYYIVSMNLVVSERRAKQMLLVAFFGAIAAESQHVFEVMLGTSSLGKTEEALRTTAYMAAHSESWLVAGPLVMSGRVRTLWLQILAGLLFLVGNVLHQTRSTAIAAGCAALLYYGWFVPGRIADKLRRFQNLGILLFVGFVVAIPSLNLERFADSYSNRMSQMSSTDQTTEERRVAVEFELGDWMDGNVLIGRGLGYFFSPEMNSVRPSEDIAYGHVGYVTYLSQLGIAGFVVYGFWLPLSAIMTAKRVRGDPRNGAFTQHLASMAGAIMLVNMFLGAMSGSLMGPEVLPGVLAGFAAVAGRRGLVSKAFFQGNGNGARSAGAMETRL